jgi:hypothetical protein
MRQAWRATSGWTTCARLDLCGSLGGTVVRRVSQYEEFADECRLLAAAMKSPEHKRMLQEMAAAWDKVASERRQALAPEETDGE